MTEQKPSIGLIGCGLMGSGIAASLLRNGYSLTILEHAGNQPLESLLSAGAKSVPAIANVAAAADLIILCVTGSPQVEAVLFSAGGLLEHLRAGTTLVDCSTAIPGSTVRIAAEVEKAGGRFLDAAMTRTPKEAAEGRLNLIVGAAAPDYEAVLPVLEAFSEVIVHAGPVGAGHRMKLLHNYVSLGFSAVLAEAAAMARRADMSPQLFCDVLATGGGGGVVLERLRPYIENGNCDNFRFATSNALKDLEYYCAMADEQQGWNGVAQSIRALYSQVTAAGLGQIPLPQIIDHLATTCPPEREA